MKNAGIEKGIVNPRSKNSRLQIRWNGGLFMKRILQILSLLLFVSCNTNTAIVSYSYRNLPNCTLRIPKGYEEWIITSEHEREQQYYYDDSSFFYISNNQYNANYKNIEMLGDSIFNFRFQDKVLWEVLNENLGTELYPILPDAFELSGKDEDSLYWRDIVVGEISIGYVNVPSSKKTFYDSCLNSYAIKAKTATMVKGLGYKGFIFDKEHYIWGFPPESGRYTLNKKEVAQAEKLLREKIDEYIVSHQVYADPPIKKKTLRKYVRQYVGYLTDNNEVVVKIYLNKIDPDDDSSTDILEYFDGGSNHWSIQINLNTGELYDMEVNGKG